MQHTANHEQPIQCSGPALAAAQSHGHRHQSIAQYTTNIEAPVCE